MQLDYISPGMEELIPLIPMQHLSEARCPDDDWAGISEFAARKKRQNRLNQRAYRRRKATTDSALHLSDMPIRSTLAVSQRYNTTQDLCMDQAMKYTMRSVEIALIQRSGYAPDVQFGTSSRNGDLPPLLASSSHLNPNAELEPHSSRDTKTVLIVSVGPTTIKFDPYEHCPLPADHLLTLVRYNLYRACAANAISLGIDPSAMHDDIPSPFFNLDTYSSLNQPPSLRPTEKQLTTDHHPYIDLFPLSQMRDNLLAAGNTFDDDELCADLAGKNSTEEHTGLIVWGEPWDPMGWEVSVHIARKWSWLFAGCEELLVATDFWRGQRGESALADGI